MVADVVNATLVSVTSTGLIIEYSLPPGFYSGILIYCSPEDSSLSAEFNVVGKGITSIGCYFLEPGSFILAMVFAYKGNNVNDDNTVGSSGVPFFVQTRESKFNNSKIIF